MNRIGAFVPSKCWFDFLFFFLLTRNRFRVECES